MATTKWQCPIHKVNLHTIEDYPGALVHDGCLELFTVIDNHLCILDGKWKDVETEEYREVK